jgi:hypothetical protein
MTKKNSIIRYKPASRKKWPSHVSPNRQEWPQGTWTPLELENRESQTSLRIIDRIRSRISEPIEKRVDGYGSGQAPACEDGLDG